MPNHQPPTGTPSYHSPRDGEINPTLLMLSNSVLLFLRVNIGYRLIDGRTLALPFLVHTIVGYVFYTAEHAPEEVRQCGLAMLVYAFGIMVLSGIHSRRGLRLAFREPNPVHSMSRGVSIFFYTYMFRRYRLSVRAAELCEFFSLLLLGIFFINSLRWYFLGWWLIASAICLAAVETIAQYQMQDTLLDLRDSRTELQGQLNFEQGVVNAVNTPPAPKTKGQTQRGPFVATLSPELERLNTQPISGNRSRTPRS